jgi:hypothetical protein
MKPSIVVTEGETDCLLLRAILDESLTAVPVSFVAAGGWSAADAYARSVLVHGAADVVLVVDADSSDANLAEERRRFLQRSLREIPSPSRRHVIVVAPEIEGLLFRDRAVLEQLVGRRVSDTELVRAEFEPRKVLSEMTGGEDRLELFRERLPRLDLSVLKTLPEIRELREALHEGELAGARR